MAAHTATDWKSLVRRKAAQPSVNTADCLFPCAQRVPLILGARRADRSVNASPRRDPLVSSQDELRDTARGGTAVLSHRWTHGTDSPPRQHDGVALRPVRPNHTRLATGRQGHSATLVGLGAAQTRSHVSISKSTPVQNRTATHTRSSVMSTANPGRQERLWNRDRPTIHYMC